MSSVLSSKRTSIVQDASVEIIRCIAAEDVYCLEMSVVAGVKPAGDLRPCPRAEANDPVGLFEFRGQEVPVFDLLDLLDLPNDSTRSSRYVVLIDHPVQRYGLRVESVSRVIRLTQDHVLPLPKPLEHIGRWFRGIADFTRDRQFPQEAWNSQDLPGVSMPKQTPINRRRSQHQMQLILNSKTLLPGHEAKPDPAIPFECLLRRYAAVAPLGRIESGKQIVMFPAGVVADRQLLIGLSIAQIAEISEPLTIVPIPAANPAIAGLVQWRNCPVPVINLRASLQFEEASGPITHFLIARDHRGSSLLALPVAGRLHSARLPIDHRPCPLPEESWRPFVFGAFELEERLLILPRLDALSGLASPQQPA